MTPVAIGHNLYRVTVRSERRRRELASTPEVIVRGDRVIFPERLYGPVMQYLGGEPKRAKRNAAQQTKLEV